MTLMYKENTILKSVLWIHMKSQEVYFVYDNGAYSGLQSR